MRRDERENATGLTSAKLAAISRLFSSSVFQEMGRKGRSPLFARLVNDYGLLDSVGSHERVRGLFDSAFSFLKREGLRDEYVYKSALTRQILFRRHCLRTASMLTEFRVGECKADLAVLNGTGTVYEVKSERDSLSRLERQMNEYAKVFASVYVVTADCHVNAVMRLVPEYVGILYLNRRQQLSTLREAIDQPGRTCPSAIFDAIRVEEARRILASLNIPIPNVPNTLMSSALRELFLRLDPETAHDGMVSVLKTTRNLLPLSVLLKHLPASLQTAALSIPLRRLDHTRLIAAVNTRLVDAMAWV